MFVIMCDDKEITTTENVGTNKVEFVLKPNVPERYKPWGLFRNSDRESAFNVMRWFEDRAFPEERVGCKELLEELGLDRYDPWEIVKKTRGPLMTDYFWLKVEPTDTYEEFSLRGAAGFPPVQF